MRLKHKHFVVMFGGGIVAAMVGLFVVTPLSYFGIWWAKILGAALIMIGCISFTFALLAGEDES